MFTVDRMPRTAILPRRSVAWMLLLAGLTLGLLGCDSTASEGVVDAGSPAVCDTEPCDDDTGDDDTDDDGPDDTDPDAVAFEGFTLEPEEGAFWEYAWERTSWSGPSGGSSDRGEFRVTLDEKTTIDGRTVFTVDVCGERAPERWNYLAFEDDRILGSEDGATFRTLFDGKRSTWAGSGFFADMSSDVLVTGVESRIENDFLQSEAVRVGVSSNSAQCEIIAGIRVCGSDESESFTHYEYWKPRVGPVGLYTRSAVGFYGSMVEVGLIDYSMTPVTRIDTAAAPEVNVYARDVQLVNGPGVQFFARADQALTYQEVIVVPPAPYEDFSVAVDTSLVQAGVPVPLQDDDVGYVRVNGTWTFIVVVLVDGCPLPRLYSVETTVSVEGGVSSSAAKRDRSLVRPVTPNRSL